MEKIMKEKSLEERKKEYSKIMEIYPTKIPIILDKNPKFPNLKDPIKNKFLSDNNSTIKKFISTISKTYLQLDMIKEDLSLEIKLYSTSDNIEISTNEEESILNIYNKYKDEDGFLYLKYSYLYTKNKNVEKKEKEGTIIMKQFHNKIPIILQKDPNYSDIKDIPKSKFLIDKFMTIEQFISYLNNNYLNENEDNIYLTSDNRYNLHKSEILSYVYNKYKDKNDEFLYLLYFYTTDFSIEEFKLKSLEERKKEYDLILQKNPEMIPIIIEKDSNYPDNKNISKNNILVKETLKVYELIQLINLNYLNLSPFINGKYLNLVLTISPYHINLYNNDYISTIYEECKNEDGFLYMNYSYEYIQIDYLPFFSPKYKYNNSPKERKESISEIVPKKKFLYILKNIHYHI